LQSRGRWGSAWLRSSGRRAWWILGFAGAALAVWSVLFMPRILIDARDVELTPKDRLDTEGDVRSSLLQTIGGGVLLAGLYFTAQGFRLTRQGHITDRYARSIEQIGHDRVDVRIGGVFALERIARDSPSDRQTIVEILSAFVREHTRKDPRTPITERVVADVQAALTVLGRRPGIASEPRRLNLYHCGLNDADLMSADLRKAMLYYSYLVDTRFSNARLDDAGLSFCHAERAAFTGASARGANFVNAVYKNGWFLHADLTDADFYGCDLSGSDFGRRYAEEGNPPFPPAVLTNARMTKAVLTDTNLRGVDLSTVRGLLPEQLQAAITDENTVPPERWGGGEDQY
jgi:uncharacterized protein YjbI with pentapeptide repeats